MSEPRAYDLGDPAERQRLLRETLGYLKTWTDGRVVCRPEIVALCHVSLALNDGLGAVEAWLPSKGTPCP